MRLAALARGRPQIEVTRANTKTALPLLCWRWRTSAPAACQGSRYITPYHAASHSLSRVELPPYRPTELSNQSRYISKITSAWPVWLRLLAGTGVVHFSNKSNEMKVRSALPENNCGRTQSNYNRRESAAMTLLKTMKIS